MVFQKSGHSSVPKNRLSWTVVYTDIWSSSDSYNHAVHWPSLRWSVQSMLQESTLDPMCQPLCLNFPPGNKAFAVFIIESESLLEQFSAHPRCLNSAYCTGALIIEMFSANHTVMIVNQETVKNIHVYLKQIEINPPFWYNFYHIMKLWTKKRNLMLTVLKGFEGKHRVWEKKNTPLLSCIISF